MTKFVTYVAYDDTEFLDEEECKRYEQYAIDMMKEIYDKCNFYDADGDIIECDDCDEIESLLNWMDELEDCYYMEILETVGESAWVFVRNYFGYIFPEEKGKWTYDVNKCDWTKVA